MNEEKIKKRLKELQHNQEHDIQQLNKLQQAIQQLKNNIQSRAGGIAELQYILNSDDDKNNDKN